MVPSLPESTKQNPKTVEIERIPFEKLEIGMVVLFKTSKSGYLLHRIFKKINNDAFWTKGDANISTDKEYVTKDNYVGVMKNAPPAPKYQKIFNR